MPSFCAVQNCDDKYGHAENISFHKFPIKRKDLLQKWLAFAQRGPDWQPSKWSAICSRHFNDDDFTCTSDRKILKKTAVPSVQAVKDAETDPELGCVNIKQKAHPTSKVLLDETKKETMENGKNGTQTLEDENGAFEEEDEENQTPIAQTLNSPSTPKIKCRLCGSVCSAVVSFSTNFEIYGMIQKCFPTLNIQKDDHLPKEMCRVCLRRLENFSRFIDKVLETQSELQRKYRTEKANNNSRTAERQLKVKQEPVVRVKQEVAEGFESFISDDLDMAGEEGCEQEADIETNVEQKYDFCDFPMLNAQDIINNCDIMEIINLDDPFIDIPDDDANTNCEHGVAAASHQSPPGQPQQQQRSEAVLRHQANKQRQEQQMNSKRAVLMSAHELLQAHLLSEEHNYANTVDDMKEEWQLKNTYKTEKTECGEQQQPMQQQIVEHGGGSEAQQQQQQEQQHAHFGPEFTTNVEHEEDEQATYAGEEHHQTEDADERNDIFKMNYQAAVVMSTSNLDTDDLNTNNTAASSSVAETRSAGPIVTSVSELADAASLAIADNTAMEHDPNEKSLMVTSVNNLPASPITAGTATIPTAERETSQISALPTKANTKPNIVVLNESIVKSSAAFQLHTCPCCQLKFFSGESLNQHYMVAHQAQLHNPPYEQQQQQNMLQEGGQHSYQQDQQQQQQQHHHHHHDQHQHQQPLQQQLQQHEHQQHQTHQLDGQLPMVSVPAEYLSKALNQHFKLEKGYGSPNTCADSGYKPENGTHAYQQANLYDQPIRFASMGTVKDTTAALGAPNAVRILEMKRTFLRQHEPPYNANNGISDAAHCQYNNKMSANGVAAPNFCAVNFLHTENQQRNAAPACLAMSRLQESKRPPKEAIGINRKVLTRLKALERKLKLAAAPNVLAVEYRHLRRLNTMLQLKCKSLELQVHKWKCAKGVRRKQQRLSCNICKRTDFKSIYQLLQHKRARAHWPRRVRKHFAVTCCGCEKFFCSKRALRNHMRYICQSLPLCWFKFQMQTFTCRHCRQSTFNHWRLYRRHEVKCKMKEKQRLCRTAHHPTSERLGGYNSNNNNNNSERRWRLQRTKSKLQQRVYNKTRKKSLKAMRGTSDTPPALQAATLTKNLKHLPAANTTTTTSTALMRDYVCQLCHKVFASANSLSQHHITHTDQRRHKCHLCPRAFKRRNGLMQHVRGYHLQLKPHQCPVCQRSYALKTDMVRCRHALIKRTASNIASSLMMVKHQQGIVEK